jgi:hypothetical protein
MIKLKDHIKVLVDLKRQHEIVMFRHYNRETQCTLLNLIIKELDTWKQNELIPKELYFSLSMPEKLAQNNVIDLCLLYKKVIIINSKTE